MMGQGPGPGFTTVATRRSVIFRVDGLECVLTFCWICASVPASEPSSAPPSIAAEVFNTPRRLILMASSLDIIPSPPQFLVGPAAQLISILIGTRGDDWRQHPLNVGNVAAGQNSLDIPHAKNLAQHAVPGMDVDLAIENRIV